MESSQLSVVIPTRNRAGDLRLCLSALMTQIPADGSEVVVADDGSTDRTRDVLAEFPDVKVVHTGGKGASAARNAALREATGTLVLFIDDDIVATPGLVQRHLNFHRLHPGEESALVGLVTWDPRRKITAHMRWLEDGGPLFSFNTIDDPERVEPAHFCTANASVKRALLARLDGPFNEEIPRFTDVELALRLTELGMRLQFDGEAVAWHLRTDNPASTDERMYIVGKASVILDELHPGAAPAAAELSSVGHYKVVVARMLSPFCPFLGDDLSARVWASRAAWAYASGRADALSERVSLV